MNVKKGKYNSPIYYVDQALKIWLGLIGLTVFNYLIAESQSPVFGETFIVCLAVLLKGELVIDYFMELKYASKLTRRLMKSYFYLITFVVGLSMVYSQSLFKAGLFWL